MTKPSRFPREIFQSQTNKIHNKLKGCVMQAITPDWVKHAVLPDSPGSLQGGKLVDVDIPLRDVRALVQRVGYRP